MVQIPDSTPADFAEVFRSTATQSGLGGLVPEMSEARTLPAIAAAVGSLCAKGVIVALDEFQTCLRGPLRALPSLLQSPVDDLQDIETEGGIIVLGSVQTEMEMLLQDSRMPLFGRTTFNLNLGPWDLRTVFQVCDLRRAHDPKRFLTLWTLFGGVPKYWRHFAEVENIDPIPNWRDWADEVCASLFLRTGAPLHQEGEMLLQHDLRRTSLAILRVVAERTRCSYADLRRAVPEVTSPGPYLKTLIHSLASFRRHVKRFLGTDEGKRFSDWDQEWALYSPRFSARQRDRLETEGWICRELSDFRNRLDRSDAGATGAFIVSEKVAGRD